MWRLIVSGVGLTGMAATLVGCRFPFGETDPCEMRAAEDQDVVAPVAGTQKAQLMWVETMTTTDFSLTVDGPIEVENGCPGQHDEEFRFQAASGDGLIAVSNGPLSADTTVDLFGVDPMKLLLGGVAPDQPNLSQENPVIQLELVRDGTTWISGTVRAKTTDQQITLGIITFEHG